MTIVRAFRGVRYDADRVDLSRVIVPPYDVIAPDERGAFYDRDPHNAIRFELTRKVEDEATADYAEIADTLAAWRAEGVLIRDEGPAYYVMKQTFTAPDGGQRTRIGFFGELGLEDYSARVVRPHERTLAGPKKDRLKLLRAARANLSSVFLLYEDREREIEGWLEKAFDDAPIGRAEDDAGVVYELAALRDPDARAAVERAMAERPVVIADGHHRYETAVSYRDEQREQHGVDADAPWESTLAFFANAYAPGSLLLPIHRVVLRGEAPDDERWAARLPGWRCERVELGDAGIEAALARHLEPLAGRSAFVADDGSGVLRVFQRDEPLGDALMVRILEDDVLGGVFGLDPAAIREGAVSFPKSAARAFGEVREGDGVVALYLNPLLPEDVFRVTGEGEVMPQKSTFFYPKIPTGLVFRVHGE